MDLSENVGYIPNEIAICYRDNDQQTIGKMGYTIFRHTQMLVHCPASPFDYRRVFWYLININVGKTW